MKKIGPHSLLKAIIADLIIYAFFCALLWWLGAYNFCYLEQLGTFYYRRIPIVMALERPGGVCDTCANFIIQFFVTPAAGVLITALLLTVISILSARLVRYLSGTLAYTPIALLPAISLAFLHYNVNYMYSGTVAFVFLLCATNFMFGRNGQLLFSTLVYRVLYSVVITFFLFSIAGSIAILFGILVFMCTLIKRPKEAVYYLICPVLTVLQAAISVHSGLVCDMGHALLPDGYFTHRLHASSLVSLPWILMIAVTAVGCVLAKVQVAVKVKWAIFWLSFVGAIVFSVIGGRAYVQPENELFKELNCYVRSGDWDRIIEKCSQQRVSNLMQQNLLNMALAEKGQLADSLFHQKCVDIRNIYITGESNPYMYMLLSDIYYSMGHIALAQRHAFEANEALNNGSPRMLQRLVDTNIAFGNYNVARRYLERLDHTIYYRDWVRQREALLSDEAVEADSVMRSKRACIFPDDRFAAYYGLDDDLKQVLRSNPSHAATAQYLGALYLLSKDSGKFMEFVDEFYGTPALPAPLGAAFQEAIVGIQHENTDSVYRHFGIDPNVIERYNQYKSKPETNRDNYWYFSKFSL